MKRLAAERERDGLTRPSVLSGVLLGHHDGDGRGASGLQPANKFARLGQGCHDLTSTAAGRGQPQNFTAELDKLRDCGPVSPNDRASQRGGHPQPGKLMTGEPIDNVDPDERIVGRRDEKEVRVITGFGIHRRNGKRSATEWRRAGATASIGMPRFPLTCHLVSMTPSTSTFGVKGQVVGSTARLSWTTGANRRTTNASASFRQWMATRSPGTSPVARNQPANDRHFR